MTEFPQMDHHEVLSVKLAIKRQEHRDLDEAVRALPKKAAPTRSR